MLVVMDREVAALVITSLVIYLPLFAGVAALLSLLFLRGALPMIGVPLSLGIFAIVVGSAFFSTGGWSAAGLDGQFFIGTVLSGEWYVVVGSVLLIGCVIRGGTLRGHLVLWPPGLVVAGVLAVLVDGLLFAVGRRSFPTPVGAHAIVDLLIPLSVVLGVVVLVVSVRGCRRVQRGEHRNLIAA